MTTMAFDTLAYAKKLQRAGFTTQQAEAQAEALREIVEDNIASKHDLEDLKKDLTIRIGAMFATAVGILSILVTILAKFH